MMMMMMTTTIIILIIISHLSLTRCQKCLLGHAGQVHSASGAVYCQQLTRGQSLGVPLVYGQKQALEGCANQYNETKRQQSGTVEKRLDSSGGHRVYLQKGQ